MDKPEELFDQIAETLSRQPGVRRAKMFGMPSLKINGNAFMGYLDGEVTFKLNGEAHARALSLPGAHRFDPGKMGRPMKEWISVPAEASADWVDLADAALAYVAKMPPK